MTPGPRSSAAGWKHAPPEKTPRLRLKPKAPTTGFVDGAWWPHSHDLQAEIPDLLAVLSVRLGRIDRVIYNLAEWETAPRKVQTDEGVIRLAGYRRQPVHTIEVLGHDREQVVLLVVPPETDPERAHQALMAAAAPDSASTIDLLLTGPQDRHASTSAVAT